jgi:hypothetical protein
MSLGDKMRGKSTVTYIHNYPFIEAWDECTVFGYYLRGYGAFPGTIGEFLCFHLGYEFTR